MRECDKSCDIHEYLDYENCKCRKKLIDKLVEECTENIKGTKLVEKFQQSCTQLKMNMKINVVLAHCTLYYFC